MKRRDFLFVSSVFTSGTFLLKGQVFNTFNTTQLLDEFNCGDTDRAMVIIQLKGGNDGLNTVILLGKFDTYANLRPDIYIPQSKSIVLDSSLAAEAQVALHPSMVPFKSLYDSGKLSIVQEVGYPNHNRSHFKSTDIWLSGGDGNRSNLSEGWMARYLESSYNPADFQDPLGIQLGNKTPSLGFHTEEEHTLSINLSGQDPAGFFSLVSGIGAPAPNFDNRTDFGKLLEHITNTEEGVNDYAERISQVFNSGKTIVPYPDTDIANQLKTIARLLSGGSKTKVFLANLGGFDTHRNQVERGNKTIGNHADLLSQLSEAVLAFQSDLEQLGLDDRVITYTFSEFGRKISQNGSYGTDHGNFAPLFVIGKGVRPGVIGVNPNIDDLANNDQLKTMQHDYRQVFSSIAHDWMGADNSTLREAFLSDFATNGIPIIEPAAIACKTQGETPLVANGNAVNVAHTDVLLYPNPAREIITIAMENTVPGDYQVAIVSMFDAQVKGIKTVRSSENETSTDFDVSSLEQGYYIARIHTPDGSTLTKKFIKSP